MKTIGYYIGFLLLAISTQAVAQSYKVDANRGRLLDAQGHEVSFFGSNYTAPFAHCYRMHKMRGLDQKESIARDVYHMVRMGSNAYRVHIWDVEISDSIGNLVQNDHLDLFDYMLDQMERRGIKLTLTCMAYGGDGYPDGNTPGLKGFAMNCNKFKCTYNEQSIRQQARYLKQLLNHVNPYNHRLYKDDPDIVGFEIINEPKQNDPDKVPQVASYVTRLAKAIRSTGCKKPVIYNVSESYKMIKSYMAAPIDGVAFQWYPSGLVSGHARQENILPLVSHYTIPFLKEKNFLQKARWVYEFDGADVGGSYLYPAIARAFREAGFQWVTQFAYDPFWMANSNTDYQTHYLNLIYTPAKAVSYRIAAESFRNLPLGKGYGDYPANNTFGPVTVDFKKDLSVMNSDTLLAYSNNILNEHLAIKPEALRHIMGHGSSSIVSYDGTGTYLLDRIEPGIWRLEIYPDVLWLNDPFGTPSPDRDVAEIQANRRNMQISLPELGKDYLYEACTLNDGQSGIATDGKISVRPGVWILRHPGKKDISVSKVRRMNGYEVSEYYECPSNVKEAQVVMNVPESHETGKDLLLTASVIAPSDIDSVTWVGGLKNKQTFRFPMHSTGIGFDYEATIPGKILEEGILEYSIVVHTRQGSTTFPSQISADPQVWNFYSKARYATSIVSADAPLEIFNAAKGFDKVEAREQLHSVISYLPECIRVSTAAQKDTKEDPAGLLLLAQDKIDCRAADGSSFSKIRIQFLHPQKGTTVKVQAADKNGSLWEISLTLGDEQVYEIPASAMKETEYQPVRPSYPPFAFPECHCIANGKSVSLNEAITLFVLLQPDKQNTSFEIQKVELTK